VKQNLEHAQNVEAYISLWTSPCRKALSATKNSPLL